MNLNITFKERAEIAKKILAKQKPVTYEEAKRQIEFLKQHSSQNNNKVATPIRLKDKTPTELNPLG